MTSRRQRLLLQAANSDPTFKRSKRNGNFVLEGKCIHCRRRLVIHLDGRPISDATVEHIIPKHHGGTDDADNLAVACARCNSEKGLRHDHKHRDDPKLQEIIRTLQARKRERGSGRA